MTTDDINHAREAFRQQRWSIAFATLSDPKVSESLRFEDLQRLAIAAHMLGRPQERHAAGERAYHAALADGDLLAAARAAFWLGFGHLEYGEIAQAGGWLARSGGLLEEIGEPTVVEGYLLIPAGLRSLGEGAVAQAREAFEAMGEIARRFEDPDLATISRLGLGDCHIRSGRRREGIELLDEAMLAVASGEVSPEIVGLAYCAAIESYQQVFDLRRAQEWTTALAGWCETQPDAVPFRGRCMVYRSELMVLHGQWDAAADEVRRARERLAGPPIAPSMGEADYQQAELARLRGSFAAAAAGYRRAGGAWPLARARPRAPSPRTGPAGQRPRDHPSGDGRGHRPADPPAPPGTVRRDPHRRGRAGRSQDGGDGAGPDRGRGGLAAPRRPRRRRRRRRPTGWR